MLMLFKFAVIDAIKANKKSPVSDFYLIFPGYVPTNSAGILA